MREVHPEGAIRNLYAAYCFAADDRSKADFADLWTEHAVMRVDGSSSALVGRQNISQLMDMPHPRWHFVPHVQVLDVSEGRATSRAYFLVVEADGTNAAHGRFYDDAELDSDGKWRWSARVTRYQWKSRAYDQFVSDNFHARAEAGK